MDRTQKQNMVSELQERFDASNLVVVAHQAGLTVAESTDLRSKMRAEGGGVKVAKNSLARIALTDNKHEAIKDLMQGPTVLAWSEDPVVAAKVVNDFAKTNKKITIQGGSLDGKALNAEEVKALADLPSLDELRGKLVGLLLAPHGKIARVVSEPASLLARVTGAYGASS